ncbi:MAG: LptF/LptG family permease [Pseudomonadota bacterium]
MPLYIRWIFFRWAQPFLKIAAAILLLFSFFDALNLADNNSQMPALDLVRWAIRRIPFNLFEMLPFAVLLSSMATAAQWVSQGEWNIVRFSGWKWRHSLIGVIAGGLLVGCMGLLCDSINARWLGGVGVNTKSVWLQNAGYILKVERIELTGAKTAKLKKIYVYPDSPSVVKGVQPEIHFFESAELRKNTLYLGKNSGDESKKTKLPAQLALPFYLVLEPSTLEKLDIFFLAQTLKEMMSSNESSQSLGLTEHILAFSFAKKIMYPFWMGYWIVWGCLLLGISPRFRYARTYQAGLFMLGALLIFAQRTLSTVLMQQEFSGWIMNGVMAILGIIGLFFIKQVIRWKTSG